MAVEVGTPSRLDALLGGGSAATSLLWPSGFRSLREMIDILHTFFNFEQEVDVLLLLFKHHKDQSKLVSEEHRELLTDRVRGWNNLFNRHGFLTLEEQTLRLSWPITYAALVERLSMLLEQFRRDAGRRAVYVLEEDARKSLPYFGHEIEESFESAWPEINTGLDCYALDQYTACVFHLMRAVEHVLRAFVYAVGVRRGKKRGSIPLEHQEWYTLISAADIKVNAFINKQWKNRIAQKRARDILRVSIADFYSFKDNVRNDLMHSRSDLLDAPTALGIINRVHKCFERLSPYLSEDSRRSLLTESVWTKKPTLL